jgi:hypothetical protein
MRNGEKHMNAIAGWMVMVGLILLGSSIEKAADKILTNQCDAKITQKGGAA